MTPVDLTNFLLATQGKPVNPNLLPSTIQTICFDSRTLKPNDLFWPLRGSNFDGQDFIQPAFDKGAAASVIDTKHSNAITREKQPLIIVKDTLTALQKFAKWYRAQHQVTTIGITGSFGKTTTRELLYAVLSTKRNGIRNQGNQNNEFGVPFNLLKLTPQDQFLIMEMGAAKPNDIAPLTEITSPHIGLITGIGPAHLDGFRDIQQIIKTKGELTASLPADGIAVIPGDWEWTDSLKKESRCQTITFGTRPGNHYRATRIQIFNDKLKFDANNHSYRLSVIGRHHISAALAAIAVATELGYTPTEIQEGFDQFQPVSGRSRLVQTQPWTVIDDTYNANPTSCEASCQTLASWNTNGKRFFILGDMLELGQNTRAYHEELGRQAANLQIDYVYTYGRNAKHVVTEITNNRNSKTKALAFDSLFGLTNEIQQRIRSNDVVLVKGSRGMRMEQVISTITGERVRQHITSPC